MIGPGGDTEVVFDHDEGRARVHEVGEEGVEAFHVVGVQAGRRFVEDDPFLREAGGGGRGGAEVSGEQQALFLAAGEGVEGLPDGRVGEPDAFQPAQRLRDAGVVGEEIGHGARHRPG
ncbi:hypothetical protein [Streptomyces sp. SID5770]|uniref:hypothetical protein n=1 Tax=unclassified Streptomyces TaxID=2593676 RepID=UPI0013715056|nr:hypothetical protein [Streptomyces sp. SID5770]MZE53420.1 hypothetical protein [Streptomyces sp. SID5770]